MARDPASGAMLKESIKGKLAEFVNR